MGTAGLPLIELWKLHIALRRTKEWGKYTLILYYCFHWDFCVVPFHSSLHKHIWGRKSWKLPVGLKLLSCLWYTEYCVFVLQNIKKSQRLAYHSAARFVDRGTFRDSECWQLQAVQRMSTVSMKNTEQYLPRLQMHVFLPSNSTSRKCHIYLYIWKRRAYTFIHHDILCNRKLYKKHKYSSVGDYINWELFIQWNTIQLYIYVYISIV
jgi:hypothetical protein